MKKLIFTFFVVFSAYGAILAQTSQGNILLGGGIRVSSSKQETSGDDFKTSSFAFTPNVGYFVADNIAVGLGLGIYSGKEGDDKTSGFEFNPFARYYKFTSNEKFAFFGEAGLGFASGTFKDAGGDKTKYGHTRFYVAPGFAYFFNEKWAIDMQLRGFEFKASDDDKDNDGNEKTEVTFGVESFFTEPTIGFRYIIGN